MGLAKFLPSSYRFTSVKGSVIIRMELPTSLSNSFQKPQTASTAFNLMSLGFAPLEREYVCMYVCGMSVCVSEPFSQASSVL